MYYSFSPSTLPAPQVQLHSTLFKSGELANTVKSMQKCGNRVVFDLPVSTELTRRLLKHCISLKLLRMLVVNLRTKHYTPSYSVYRYYNPQQYLVPCSEAFKWEIRHWCLNLKVPTMDINIKSSGFRSLLNYSTKLSKTKQM